jgi:DNA recombination protein RmuC
MTAILPWLTVALVAIALVLQVVGLLRRAGIDLALERTERAVRDEIGRNRAESASLARESRAETSATLASLNESVVRGLAATADTVAAQLGRLVASNETKLDAVRTSIDERLQSIEVKNANSLETVRQTVDEKLQGTLEKRLGESFRLVSERLELVSRGLGEMQNLASGVGDLKRVLTNVKTRGSWGEVQLGALLDQILTPEQYAQNVATKNGAERVEYAVKLPGRGDTPDEVVWLPLDAKFPLEDYQRLIDAQERSDIAAVEAASRQLEATVKAAAATIAEKYLSPPQTTDFAIMFLPTEGLYAEVIRRAGLVDLLQQKSRVVVAGPTTLAALLNSLQMGFRTLAIQKRSSEVWAVLGGVKAEFEKYGAVLEKVQKKLREASDTIDQDVARRTRAIQRKLRDVEQLPEAAMPAMRALSNGDRGEEGDNP